MSTYRRRATHPPAAPDAEAEVEPLAPAPPPPPTPQTLVPTIAALGQSLPPSLIATEIGLYQNLVSWPPPSAHTTPDDERIARIRAKRAARRQAQLDTAKAALDLSLMTQEAQAARNAALARICRAKTPNHTRRQQLLDQILRENARSSDPRATAALEAAVRRDKKYGGAIDRSLWGAVVRRRDRVQAFAIFAGPATSQIYLETSKGAWLVYPTDMDPDNPADQIRWMHTGFAQKQSRVRSPLVDFQITWSDMAHMDREWMRYVVRRICRAIGRDPDRDVLAASHEPDIHPPSKKDGNKVQPHAHVAVRTCNPDGSVWRCQNMHLVVQRELEAINAQRGWDALSTASVAKGRQAFWYSPKGEHKIGWWTITTNGRDFTQTDDDAQVLAVAAEAFPDHAWSRPGAGMLVVNAQFSERRTALHRQDLRRLVAADEAYQAAMAEVCAIEPKILSTIVSDCVQLRYFSRPTTPAAAAVYQRLLDAVLRRDQAAITYYCGRLEYLSEL